VSRRAHQRATAMRRGSGEIGSNLGLHVTKHSTFGARSEKFRCIPVRHGASAEAAAMTGRDIFNGEIRRAKNETAGDPIELD
jgi:hypothetical protein